MQRLEDLDWFGPEMPYVQYGGGVLALLLSSPGAQSSEGSLQAGLVVSNLWESNQPFPTWWAFPFIAQGGAPIYSYLALCLCTVGAQIVLVSRRGPLSRSGVGELDPGDLLAQEMILAISLSGVSPWRCPILAQSGRRDHPVGHSGVSFGLVRRSLGFLPGGSILRSSVTR